MKYKLIIAEKPSVAQNIADAIGATEKVRDENGNGYIKGNGYVVSWCYGHLVELYEPEQYDERYSNWSIDDLPIIPEHYQYKVKLKVKKQFDIIRELITSNDCIEVIEGTDAAREGELIFRLVSSMAKNNKPTKRLWLNSMENSAILDALSKVKDISEYNNLYFSAIARQRADWLFGMNFSRYYSCRYGEYLSYGRVQTVVVAFLVKRKKEIDDFVPEDFYKVTADLGDFSVSTNVDTLSQSDKMLEDCCNNIAIVSSVEKKESSSNPPLLYDLTTMQREANKILGYSAALTLKTLQSLYEKKLASYPRTDSCYITESEENSAKKLLSYIISLGLFPDKRIIPDTFDLSHVVNDSKVNDHSALLPTKNISGTTFSALNDEEKNILLMLCYRLLAVASTSYVVNKAKAVVKISDYELTANGTEVIRWGFKSVENTLRSCFGLSSSDPKPLPNISEGDRFVVQNVSSSLEHTKPPAQYTDDTLLSAMENCGNKIDEQELKDAVKEKGLGTPATRASIIEEIIRKGFAERKKKSILATTKAELFIPLVNPKLVKPDLTGEWELQLNKIANGSYNYSTFMSGITDYVKEMIEGCKKEEFPESDKKIFKYINAVGVCPKCGRYVLERDKVFSCEANTMKNKECDFIVFKNIGSKEKPKLLTTSDMKSLLTKGRTSLKKMVNKEGKEYSCYFKFKPDYSSQLDREFPPKPNNKKKGDS